MASATLPRNGRPIPFDHVIGIDTHRDFHVAVVLAPNGGKLGELTFPTSSNGYEQLVNWSEQFGVRPRCSRWKEPVPMEQGCVESCSMRPTM